MSVSCPAGTEMADLVVQPRPDIDLTCRLPGCGTSCNSTETVQLFISLLQIILISGIATDSFVNAPARRIEWQIMRMAGLHLENGLSLGCRCKLPWQPLSLTLFDSSNNGQARNHLKTVHSPVLVKCGHCFRWTKGETHQSVALLCLDASHRTLCRKNCPIDVAAPASLLPVSVPLGASHATSSHATVANPMASQRPPLPLAFPSQNHTPQAPVPSPLTPNRFFAQPVQASGSSPFVPAVVQSTTAHRAAVAVSHPHHVSDATTSVSSGPMSYAILIRLISRAAQLRLSRVHGSRWSSWKPAKNRSVHSRMSVRTRGRDPGS